MGHIVPRPPWWDTVTQRTPLEEKYLPCFQSLMLRTLVYRLHKHIRVESSILSPVEKKGEIHVASTEISEADRSWGAA